MQVLNNFKNLYKVYLSYNDSTKTLSTVGQSIYFGPNVIAVDGTDNNGYYALNLANTTKYDLVTNVLNTTNHANVIGYAMFQTLTQYQYDASNAIAYVGTNDASTVDADAYSLTNQVKLTYVNDTYGENGHTINFRIQNTGDTTITYNEFGIGVYFQGFATSSAAVTTASAKEALLAREKLTTPLVLVPGQTGLVSYTFNLGNAIVSED